MMAFDKMRHLKKKAVFLLAFSLNSGSHNIFSPNRMLSTYVAGDRARMFMSRIAMRASSLINSLIFVHCQKERIQKRALTRTKAWLSRFFIDSH